MMRGLFPAHALTLDNLGTVFAHAERYGLSIYDAMIATSALHADCGRFGSEDMEDGIVLDSRPRVSTRFALRDITIHGASAHRERKVDVS
jgi:predicted nucleic acid-binding protein